jgi:hypothetical protein
MEIIPLSVIIKRFDKSHTVKETSRDVITKFSSRPFPIFTDKSLHYASNQLASAFFHGIVPISRAVLS